MVALTTLAALRAPSDLLTASFTPAQLSTARIGLLAMIPVPRGAGRSSTLAPQYWPQTSCGIVPSFNDTFIISVAADASAFMMALATSRDLPKPMPTRPQLFPTTARALKLNRRPPLVTLEERLITTIRTFSCGLLESAFKLLAATTK